MLLVVLVLVLASFGLLVVALTTSVTMWAWVSVGLSVIAAIVLVYEWLTRRKRRAAKAEGMDASASEGIGARTDVDAPASPHSPSDGYPGYSDSAYANQPGTAATGYHDPGYGGTGFHQAPPAGARPGDAQRDEELTGRIPRVTGAPGPPPTTPPGTMRAMPPAGTPPLDQPAWEPPPGLDFSGVGLEDTAIVSSERTQIPPGPPQAPPGTSPPYADPSAASTPPGSHPGEAHSDEEPPEEATDTSDLLLVTDSPNEVLVVDERPRYHLHNCRWLAGRPTMALPLREARDLGFSPCGYCTPDAVTARSSRSHR